eukprot:COSAG01_NODE_205_length_22070_cov_106.423877_7_plen_153_part_00
MDDTIADAACTPVPSAQHGATEVRSATTDVVQHVDRVSRLRENTATPATAPGRYETHATDRPVPASTAGKGVARVPDAAQRSSGCPLSRCVRRWRIVVFRECAPRATEPKIDGGSFGGCDLHTRVQDPVTHLPRSQTAHSVHSALASYRYSS